MWWLFRDGWLLFYNSTTVEAGVHGGGGSESTWSDAVSTAVTARLDMEMCFVKVTTQ